MNKQPKYLVSIDFTSPDYIQMPIEKVKKFSTILNQELKQHDIEFKIKQKNSIIQARKTIINI